MINYKKIFRLTTAYLSVAMLTNYAHSTNDREEILENSQKIQTFILEENVIQEEIHTVLITTEEKDDPVTPTSPNEGSESGSILRRTVQNKYVQRGVGIVVKESLNYAGFGAVTKATGTAAKFLDPETETLTEMVLSRAAGRQSTPLEETKESPEDNKEQRNPGWQQLTGQGVQLIVSIFPGGNKIISGAAILKDFIDPEAKTLTEVGLNYISGKYAKISDTTVTPAQEAITDQETTLEDKETPEKSQAETENKTESRE